MTESSTAEDALSVRSEMIQRRGVMSTAGSHRQGRGERGDRHGHVLEPWASLFPPNPRLSDSLNLGDGTFYPLGGS